jgi:UDP-N-acetyl-2-amino-2-deoxyglucuronate dehydrogenase
MTKEFGIGIIGGGVIAAVHAMAVDAIPSASLVAVAEPREAAGRELATKYNATWLPDQAALLERPDIDVVIVATPSGLHADQVVAAAQAGKQVITEKPMATTVADAERMAAACDAAGVNLAVIFQNRFSRDAVLLKRAVDAGLLGRPIMGGAYVHWHRTQAYYDANGGWRGTWALDGGGALMNQSVHTIDLLQWMLGPATRISAETATLTHEIETEDTAAATVRFASGALGSIQGTTSLAKDYPIRLEIVGTEGRAVLTGSRLTVWEPGRDVAAAELLSAADITHTAGSEGEDPFGAAHRRQLTAIVEALRTGDTPPVPAAEAMKAVAIICAIYESAQRGTAVSLPE